LSADNTSRIASVSVRRSALTCVSTDDDDDDDEDEEEEETGEMKSPDTSVEMGNTGSVEIAFVPSWIKVHTYREVA